jgi:hypothetical protein
MRNFRTTRRGGRDNEPSLEKHIEGTDWVLQVFQGWDKRTGEAYWHYRMVRLSQDGSRTYSTARPVHLIQQVAALAVACRGFSQLPIAPSIRQALGSVADALAKIPLPQLNDGQPSGAQFANGAESKVESAFGAMA